MTGAYVVAASFKSSCTHDG